MKLLSKTAKIMVGAALGAQFLCMSMAMADWREDIGRFRVGFLATSQISEAMSDAEPFRLALEEALNVSVELLPMTDLSRIASAHGEGRLEYAIYPATTYAATWLSCECIEPLVLARSDDGTSAHHVVVIGRNGAGAVDSQQLAGKSIWVLSQDDTITSQIAIKGLAAGGVSISQENTTFLTADTPREALTRFVAGEGDAMIGWSSLSGDVSEGYSRGTLKLLNEVSAGKASDYRVIWRSAPVPHRVHAIRKNLDGEPKRILRALLNSLQEQDPVAYDSIEPIFGGGFQTAPQSAFSGVIDFVASMRKSANAIDDRETGQSVESETQSKGEGETPTD